MIERYSISTTANEMADRFRVEVPDYYKPRYNAAPTQLLPVITSIHPDGLSLFYWGTTPEWSKNKMPGEKVINVRSENVFEKPALKRALLSMRCALPADGFYGWKLVGKKTKIPYRFTLKDRSAFSIAGIWEEFENEDGELIHTFMMLTTTANTVVSPIMDRMPLILDKPGHKAWLDAQITEADLSLLLKPFPSENMSLYTVSPRINEVALDVPSLITPTPPADQHGNLTLFN